MTGARTAPRDTAQDGRTDVPPTATGGCGCLQATCQGCVRMSGIIGVLQFAANGLSEQQQTIANNLANSSTPGFTAQDVNFASSLAQAIGAPGGGTAQVSTTASPAPYATNGNNVDTPGQLVAAEKNTLQYQTVVEMVNAQYALVQDATNA